MRYGMCLFIFVCLGLSVQAQENSLIAELKEQHKDHITEIEKLLPKAEEGDVTAQLDLAIAYQHLSLMASEDDVPAITEEFLSWFHVVAKQDGNSDLAGQARERISAYHYHQKNLRDLKNYAEAGWREAEYDYGNFLYFYNREYVEGLIWLEKSANQGYVPAMLMAAKYFNMGNRGVDGHPADPHKTLHWFEMAANAGDKGAMYQTARLYHYGFGSRWPDFQPSIQTANQWYLKAGNNGHPQSLIYLIGLFIPNKQYDNALYSADWLIEQNWREGYFYKAMLFENGWGVEQDMDRAVELYQKAGQKGHDRATEALKRIKGEQ